MTRLHLVSEQPNKARERAAGIGGAVLAAPWVFQGVLHLVDWIGRAQTAMTITPYLGIIASPPAFLIEMIGAIGLLFYATRLEHSREAAETPRIIRPWSEPEVPKRHWFWIKLAIASATLSILAGLAPFWWLRYTKEPTSSAVGKQPGDSVSKPPTPFPEYPISTTPPARPSIVPQPPNKASSVKFSPPAPAPAKDQPGLASPAVIIPIPDRQSVSLPANDSGHGQLIAKIGGRVVRASDKPPGTLYVSLIISDTSGYRGTVSQHQRDEVQGSLEGTHKITVFSSVSYNIGPEGGTNYGAGLSPLSPKTIYYLDRSLGDSCNAVSAIVSVIVGQMRCVFFDVPPSGDPDVINSRRDFVAASGLDMEISL